jgi:hypothetical protein
LHVPADYPTIQTAINAAHSSDTIIVAEGTYYENVRYYGKGIVVASNYMYTKNWQTVQNTIINGSTCTNKDTASTVQFLDKEDSTAVLDGFTITGGTGTRYTMPFGPIVQHGAGIILNRSSAIIRNNIIINNILTSVSGKGKGGGGGIGSLYSNPTISNNLIAFNRSRYAGGILLDFSGGKIRNNVIYHNSTTSQGAGGIQIWQAPQNSAFIENNTIVGNISFTTAGGVDINPTDSASIPVVKNNIVWGNRQSKGGQIINPQHSTYNDIEDYSSETNISVPPQLQEGSFLLSTTSPCIDAGDAVVSCNDIENPANPGNALTPSKGKVRNDIGAYGGKFAKVLPSMNVNDIYVPKTTSSVQCPVGQQINSIFTLQNLSSNKITVDSVSQTNTALFSLNKKISGKVVDLFVTDTLNINFRPASNGIFYDTLKIYHTAQGVTNPIVCVITGTAIDGSTDVQKRELINYQYQLFQNYPNNKMYLNFSSYFIIDQRNIK